MKTITTSQSHFHALVFERVRRIRTVALDLLKAADEIIDTLNDTSLIENDAETRIKYVLTVNKKIISERNSELKDYFEEIDTILEKYPEFNIQSSEDVSSDITIIRGAWEKALLSWPNIIQGNPPDKQELLFQLEEVQQSLYTLCITAQILTFPDLVNQKLRDMRIGEKLDFFHEFSDEFYKPEFLPVAWQYLREHSHRVNGFMTENGIIYRASPFVPHYWLSLVLIPGIVALGCLLIWFVKVLDYPQIPPVDILFRGYIALMAGGLVHTVVEVWKQFHTDPECAANMLGNWVLWVHVKQVSIISGILTLWIGFVILVAIQQIENVEVSFLAGYSIDSFIGLFLVRFTDIASRNVVKWGAQNLPKSTAQHVTDTLAQSQKSGSRPLATSQ
jgi:hypothetical protein